MTQQWSLSPTSIDSWKTCRRRWAYRYIAKFKEPFAAAAQAGVEVHKRLETGQIDPAETWNNYRVGRMAELLKAATPEGITAREEKFTLDYEGIIFNGVKDGRGPGLILDYKTTSKPTYVKSKKALVTDPQRLIYVESEPEAETCLWLYGCWSEIDGKNPVRRRESTVERGPDRERFKLHVLQPALEMLAVTPGTDPLSLPMPADTSSYEAPCGKYPPKGCPHKDQCFPISQKVSMTTSSSALYNTLMADEASSEVPAVAALAADASAAEPAAGDYPIDLLLVDAIPLDGNFVSAHSLLQKAAASVAEDLGVIHARVVDFGKGNDRTAVQLAYDITQGPRIPVLFLDTRSAEGRAALQPLMGISRKVIRGV
jgi:hypothetical protein